MSYRKVKVERYEVICEAPNCKGEGRPWITNELKLPVVCSYCKSRGLHAVARKKREAKAKLAEEKRTNL